MPSVWDNIKDKVEEGSRMLKGVAAETGSSASSYSVFNDTGSGASTIGKVLQGLYGSIIPTTGENPRSGQIYDIATAFETIHANNFCTFDDKMGVFMDRLMSININEKEVTLSLLGRDAMYNGDSTHVTPDARRPSYAEGRNYLDYVEQVNYASGEMTTRETNNVNLLNYKDGNEIYRGTTFLYPDDNNTGYFSNKWRASLNRNSLLYKTKRLFDERKIKTLISRFGSNADPTSVDLDYTSRKGTTTGGESRGRNLLNRGRKNVNYNGYNNPYCRVWTHHHKYDEVWKMIRPFQSDATLEDLHGYLKVGREKDSKGKEDERFRKKGWRYSVLSNDNDGHYTGFVNIAPKFRGGMAMNIHPKQCMFSLENLAWRGYNPYEFEKALSWEQRGPLGGRIMWFPPYGISFSETTNAQWSSNTFIGRGEDVYTYVNTKRTGNLSFLMVIDHPSVLDYATWYDNGKNWGGDNNSTSNGITDEEILQFFAGCDSGNSNDKTNSIFGKARMTPLTDEYKKQFVPGETILIDKPADPPEVVQPEPEDAPNDVEKTVEFYVFYPNNYSGVYDAQNDILGRETPISLQNGNSVPYTLPNPIMYLLFGSGAQTFKEGSANDYLVGRFASEIDYDNGHGYEMELGALDQGSYLKGVMPQTSGWLNAKSGATYYYPKGSLLKKWYYRIDADFSKENDKLKGYTIPSNEARYKDHRCQLLPPKGKYHDGNPLKLNYDITNITKIGKDDVEKDNLYPAAMVICAMLETATTNDKKITEITTKLKGRLPSESTKQYNELVELFKYALSNKKVESVEVEGYSSTDGIERSIASKRNEYLAGQRADSVIGFINACNSTWGAKRGKVIPESGGGKGTGTAEQNENATESKLNRCAKVVIKLMGEAAKDVALSEQKVPVTKAQTSEEGGGRNSRNTRDADSDFCKNQCKSLLKLILSIIKEDGFEELREVYTVVNSEETDEALRDEIHKPKQLPWGQPFDYKRHSRCRRASLIRAMSRNCFSQDCPESESDCIDPIKVLINVLTQGSLNFTSENVELMEQVMAENNMDQINKILNDVKDDPTKTQICEYARDYVAAQNSCTIAEKTEDENNQPTSEEASDEAIGGNSETGEKPVVPNQDDLADATETKTSVGFNPIPDTNPQMYKDKDGGVWYYAGDDAATGKMILRKIDQQVVSRFNGEANPGSVGNFTNGGEDEHNASRYDQEYYFFRQLERNSPLVYNRLMDRLKYFDPAFHSMTPEGFNARLTFLNQCTRQGNTLTMSGPNAKTANNLAFGRAPFCVLRLGDFYNQMIVIDSINFDYSVSDGIVWDLNPEGAGVQPMLCRVSINFTFIGGGDMAGPIRRLQNAMSFNYYANARLYDNRADRVKYNGDDIVEGAIDWDVSRTESYAYNAAMYHEPTIEEYKDYVADLKANEKPVSTERVDDGIEGALTTGGASDTIQETIAENTEEGAKPQETLAGDGMPGIPKNVDKQPTQGKAKLYSA